MRLKELRKEQGKTQQEIANMLNISRVQYTNIENGIRETSFGTLKKLADFFGVTADYLLHLSDIPSLSKDESELLEAFGKLDAKGKHKVLGYAHGLAELSEGD